MERGRLKMTSKTSNAFVSYPLDSLMYVIIDDQLTFEAIALTEGKVGSGGDGRLVRTKQGKIDGITVIFQFWPPKEEGADVQMV